MMRRICDNNEKMFHNSPKFFKSLMDLFTELIQNVSQDWTLDMGSNSAKLNDIKAIDELSILFEKIIDHIPDKWERQSFDLIVSSALVDFVRNTCIEVVQSKEVIDYEGLEISFKEEPSPFDVNIFKMCDYLFLGNSSRHDFG
jgi:hypothetical protein